MKKLPWVVPIGAAIVLGAHPASAQEYPDRLAVNVGGNYVWDSDTAFSVRSSAGALGTSINFERDLNGEERISTPRLDGYYRFTPHHRVDFGWVRFKREGTRTIDRDLTIANTTFNIGISVDSEVDASFTKLAYVWSFYHTDKVELGLSAGAVLTDYTVMLEGPVNRVEASTSAPLPVLGLRLDYQIAPRWHAVMKTDALYIELDNDVRGSLDTTSFALEWRAARNFMIGLGSERVAIDAAVDDGEFRGQLTDFYRSARLYVGVRF